MHSSMPLMGDALYQALATLPDSGVRLWRLDGAGIAIQTPGILIYVDPFIAPQGGPGWVRRQPPILNRLPPAQLVLVTHEHDDHADPVALAQLAANHNCLFIGTAPCAAIAQKAGFPQTRTRSLRIGDHLYDDEVKIIAVEVRDDTAEAPLGYIIQVGGYRIYHGGDAQMSEHFTRTGERYAVDCCCLSVGGKVEDEQYYLAPQEAITAAKTLKSPVLIPTHWDLWMINGFDEEVWAAHHEMPEGLELHLLKPGECFTAPI